MKKIAIVFSLFFVLTVVPGVWAQDTTDLPSSGLTPDSSLYFLDTWGEKIDLALTRGQEAKTRKQVRISQEKLAEAKDMAEEGKDKAAEVASDRYGKMVSAAAENVAQAAQSGEGFADALGELLATTTAISQEVLAGVYEKVPEQAKPAIERAMQVSSKGMEKAMEAVSNVNREKVENRVNESLQRARDMMPEEAKKHLPTIVPTVGIEDVGPRGAEGKESGQEEQTDQSIPVEVESTEREQGGSAPIDVPAERRGR